MIDNDYSMQQSGRLRLRPWLIEQIQSGKYPGVIWLDQQRQIFQIPWKHAARHGWSIDRDATLFRSWAMHTGRYNPGKDNPDPKTWKANFRCALNSLPDICELQEHSRKRGNNAFRVYRLLPSVHTHKRRRDHQAFKRARERRGTFGANRQDDTCKATHTLQPTRHTTSHTQQGADMPVGDICGNGQTQGLWDTNLEDQEDTDAVFKLVDHLSCADLWNQPAEQKGWRTHTLWDHWNGSGEENLYSFHSESYTCWTDNNSLLGPNYIKELSNWSTAHQTFSP